MRITEIEINNFKAFYGNYKIDLTKKGKNLLIYGENGSGKSSLFIALKEFFNSSQNTIDLDKYDNIFLTTPNKNQNYIKVIYREQTPPMSIQTFELSRSGLNTPGTFLEETNKIKGFLDYKKLLRTYYTNSDTLNIFELIVLDILAEAINPITNNSFQQDFQFILTNINTHHWSNTYSDAVNRVKDFNDGLQQTLDEITPRVNEILDLFNYGIEISFNFPGISYISKQIQNQDLFLKVKFYSNSLTEYHTFLNEARLSAIATSIYLATILNYPQTILRHKILFLDDILIGLDSSNRMHLLDILETKFSDYQIFLGTFDLQWFALANLYLDDKKWKSIKIFTNTLEGTDFEIPFIVSEFPYIAKAEQYLNVRDYKASSAYIRTAFEEILKKYCDSEKLKITYKIKAEKEN